MKDFHYSVPVAALLWTARRLTTAQPVDNGYVAGTPYSDGVGTNCVFGLTDVRPTHPQPLNTNRMLPTWHSPSISPRMRNNLGEICGLVFDPSENIYVSTTIIYSNRTPSGPGVHGAIYKINGLMRAVSAFAVLPNGENIGLENAAWNPLATGCLRGALRMGRSIRSVRVGWWGHRSICSIRMEGAGLSPLGGHLWDAGRA